MSATTCVKSGRASSSVPTSGTRRRIGWRVFRTSSRTSCSTTISGASRSTSRPPASECRSSDRSASSASSTGRSRTRRTATRCSVLRRACRVSSIAAPSPSASRRRAAPASSSPSGSRSASRSGTCGRSTRAATSTATTIASCSPRRLRPTSTSTVSAIPPRSGLPAGPPRPRPCTRVCATRARSSVRVVAGNARCTSPRPAIRWVRRSLSVGPRGMRRSPVSARRCSSAWPCSIFRASPNSRSREAARPNGSIAW